jgi:hypothetical protein
MCGGVFAHILAAMDTRPGVLELKLELDPPDADGTSTPTGWLRAPTGPPCRFEGYVQLIGVLHELHHSSAAPSAPEIP